MNVHVSPTVSLSSSFLPLPSLLISLIYPLTCSIPFLPISLKKSPTPGVSSMILLVKNFIMENLRHVQR